MDAGQETNPSLSRPSCSFWDCAYGVGAAKGLPCWGGGRTNGTAWATTAAAGPGPTPQTSAAASATGATDERIRGSIGAAAGAGGGQGGAGISCGLGLSLSPPFTTCGRSSPLLSKRHPIGRAGELRWASSPRLNSSFTGGRNFFSPPTSVLDSCNT